MRRGSIQTWEPLARRQSANMAQFASSRSEFMTSDLGLNDIEYERKGGFFMSHKKTAFVTSAVVVIIIAAGFVGAYIGSIPKEKTYDTMTLIDGDVGCDHVEPSKFSLSHSLSPSRYRIELSPIIEEETISRLRGRVTIEFRHNGGASLREIVLNARQINVTREKLVSGILEKSEDLPSRRIRRETVDVHAPLVSESPAEIVASTTLRLENRFNLHDNVTDKSQAQSSNSEDHRAEVVEDPANATQPIVSPIESSTTEDPDKNVTREITIEKREVDEKGGFLVFYLERPIEKGEYYMEIDYEVPIDHYVVHSTNKTKNGSDKWIAASRVRPTKLRSFFPVFDDVRMKARFSLTVPRPVDTKIYSNMPLQSKVVNTSQGSKDWIEDSFEETPPISPQNLVIAATGHLETLGEKTIRNTTVNFWDENLRPGAAKYLMDIIEPVFQNLAELFTVDLLIPKLDIIGMQHSDYNSGYPGLVMIQESLFDVKDESPEVTKEHALINLIKLIGEQWLGGLVNTENSSDVWILKSSLLYLQHRLIEEIHPTFNHSTFVMDVQPEVMEADGYSVSRSLRTKLDPNHSNLFYIQDAYAQGACLIRMLHGALRETEFRAGYGSFVSRWSSGNADVASFWEAMTIKSTENEQPEGQANLSEIMNSWTTEGGYPVVTVTRNYETGSAVVRQARFTYDKLSSASQHLWNIPLTWISNGNFQNSTRWMKKQAETTIELETMLVPEAINKTWVVFNPTKSGYYRVNYDQENWKLIAEVLRENHEVFSPVTRASLIDDVFSFAFVRSIPYSIVFDVIQYLPEHERDPEPWTYLLHHVVKLNLVLYDSPAYFDYRELMVTSFLSHLYTRVGNQINEGTRLTMIAHQLSTMFDYPDYLEWVKKSYEGFESSPGLPIKNDIPSYLHNNLLCAFAKLKHELGWQWWEQKFANLTNREERNSLLSSLACFQVPSMLQAVLNEIVYSTSFEETDALIILKSFSVHPAAAQTALKFVESHWKNITRRYPKSCKIASAFLDASSTGFTGDKDIEDFQSFRNKNYESLKRVGYVTALLEAKANASVSFINSLSDNPISTVNKTTLWDVSVDTSTADVLDPN